MSEAAELTNAIESCYRRGVIQGEGREEALAHDYDRDRKVRDCGRQDRDSGYQARRSIQIMEGQPPTSRFSNSHPNIENTNSKTVQLVQGEMATVAVAEYAYDKQGRLRAEWDPRVSPALKTIYGYDAEGHVTAITPPGQETMPKSRSTPMTRPDG